MYTRILYYSKLCAFCVSFLFFGSLSFAQVQDFGGGGVGGGGGGSGGGSATNRLNQTARIGFKTGIMKWKSHLIYSTTSPTQIEIPGEVWTIGYAQGSGDYDYSYSDYSESAGYTTNSQSINFTATEFNWRYYFGNSFNIPFGYAIYKVTYPDWAYSGVTYDIEYTITQLNYGIGNEWTADWGAYFGIDWYQTGTVLSEDISVTHKSGTETGTTLSEANKTATDIKAFTGMFIITYGFGF